MNLLQPFSTLRLCVALGVLGGVPSSIALAQNQAASSQTRYLNIAYLKPYPGKSADYVKLARESWKIVYQDMVNRGRLISWKLYAVSWPNGDDQEYDYATVMEFANFGLLESPYAGVDFAKVLGSEKKYAELMTLSGEVRQLRRNDTLAILHATEGWARASNPAMSVHYLRSLPGKGADLVRIQREHFLLSNEELVKAGGASGWATTSVRFPQQLDFPYDYVSFNGYENLAQMEKEPPKAWLDKWTGASSANINSQLAVVRKRVKGQLWRLIDQTAPAAKPGT